jgi:hypothetical protein
MRTRLGSIWIGLACLMLATACGGANQPAARADGVILQDDFSDVQSGWDRQAAAEATTDYENGQYLVAVERANYDAWGTPGLDLNDMAIEADARYAGGPENNSFGLICRYTRSNEKSNFYFFFISTDGYYAMGKVVENERTYFNPAKDFEASAAIRTGTSAVNRLAAVCQGDRMSFAVNGQAVGEFTDAELTHGDVGLSAGTFTEAGARIFFDNVLVRQPSAATN